MKKIIAMIIITLSLILIGCDVTTTTITDKQTVSTTKTTLTTTSTSATTTSTTTVSTAEITTTQRVFTLEELATYTGLEGTTAYIAINGIVYDVTQASQWSNGSHNGVHYAGTDVSSIFASSPHGASILLQLPIVGILG
jgi:predicted heme/steroid binding protein